MAILVQATYRRYGPGTIHIGIYEGKHILFGATYGPECSKRSKARFHKWVGPKYLVTCKKCIKTHKIRVQWKCNICGVVNKPQVKVCLNCKEQRD